MKKIAFSLLFIFLLIGCGHQSGNWSGEESTTTSEAVSTPETVRSGQTGIRTQEEVHVETDSDADGIPEEEDPLVAHWPLDEEVSGRVPNGNDIEDVSGKGHHGRMVGNVGYNSEGMVDTGFSFSGNGKFIIPDHDDFSINTTGKLSFAFWLKTPQDIGTVQSILNKAGETDGPHEWLIWIENNRLNAMMTDNNGNGNLWKFSEIESNRWYHFAIVFTKTTEDDDILIYKDGEEKGRVQSEDSVGYDNVNTNMAIGGGFVDRNDRLLHGHLDDIFIYSRELEIREIQERMARQNQ